MVDLSPGSIDRQLLERAARIETQQRPYENNVSGVEYDDLIEFFSVDDSGVHPTLRIPLKLSTLSDAGYLREVYPSGSSANAAYRLTERGWETVSATRD